MRMPDWLFALVIIVPTLAGVALAGALWMAVFAIVKTLQAGV